MILLLWLSFLFADGKVLLQIERSKPGVSESFIVTTDGHKEYLTTTSNRYHLKKKEFGTYQRTKGSLEKRLRVIEMSQRKASKNLIQSDPHGWQILILNTKIDQRNKKFSEIFPLLKKLALAKTWKPKTIYKVKIHSTKGDLIKVTDDKTSIQSFEYFKECNHTYDSRPICEFKKGFVFLN